MSKLSILLYNIILWSNYDQRWQVGVVKVKTLMIVANSLTKHVSIEKFAWCLQYMGLSTLAIKFMIILFLGTCKLYEWENYEKLCASILQILYRPFIYCLNFFYDYMIEFIMYIVK